MKKYLIILILPIYFLSFNLVLGCTPKDNIVEYKYGAKLSVNYYSDRNETSVLHYIPANDANHKDPPLKPDLTINGQTIKDRHIFEFFDMVGYDGRKPSTIPTDMSLSIIHSIAIEDEWHFPPNVRLSITADGHTFDIPVYSQIELMKDDPSDAEFYEVLITSPTYDMYMKIANSSSVTIQIGQASFNLDEEIILSYRDFVTYLTPDN